MLKEKKQNLNKKEVKIQKIKIYDVLPSVQNKKNSKKSLKKLDRSECCL